MASLQHNTIRFFAFYIGTVKDYAVMTILYSIFPQFENIILAFAPCIGKIAPRHCYHGEQRWIEGRLAYFKRCLQRSI